MLNTCKLITDTHNIIMYTSKKNYVNMQNNYAYMQDIYV